MLTTPDDITNGILAGLDKADADVAGLTGRYVDKLKETLKDIPIGVPVEIWFQDEMRIGQKNGCVRQSIEPSWRPASNGSTFSGMW